MHVYLRWYENGQPKGYPQRLESENAAQSAVLASYPKATFGPRTKTLHQPNFDLSGIDEVLYAYSDLKALVSNLSPRYCFRLLSQPSVYSMRQLERINFRSWIDFKNDF